MRYRLGVGPSHSEGPGKIVIFVRGRLLAYSGTAKRKRGAVWPGSVGANLSEELHISFNFLKIPDKGEPDSPAAIKSFVTVFNRNWLKFSGYHIPCLHDVAFYILPRPLSSA